MLNSDLKKEKISLVLCLLALLYLFYQLMRPFVLSLVLSGIFVILFYPMYQRLKAKTGKPRMAAFFITTAIFSMILLPVTTIVSLVVDQVSGLLKDVDLTNVYNSFFVPFLQKVQSHLPSRMNLTNLLSDFGQNLAGTISHFPPKVVFGTAGFVFDFFIMIISIYFLFLEGPKLIKLFYAISPMRDAHEQRLFHEIKNTIDASVYGYLVTSLVQALLAAFSFYITGLSGSIILGTLTFFMAMVPLVGAAGVWVPVCIWLFLNGQIGWGIFNGIWGLLVISGIDNILRPMIIQGKTHIHSLLIFFSIFGGIVCFGPLGILFGPVITATLIATIKIYREEFV